MEKYDPVLVVEDDSKMRRLLISIVKKIGYTNIVESDNGQKAWMLLNNTEIGMMITDLHMPVMDGLKLSRMVRANAKYNHIPIVIVTSSNTKESIIKAAKAGVDSYVIKPFNLQQITEKIDAAIVHREEKNVAKENKKGD
ncbi:MAG: response regulator [SAR324 cluster bacterium]|nr:response regulator [SAR324 cluster bacterium]